MKNSTVLIALFFRSLSLKSKRKKQAEKTAENKTKILVYIKNNGSCSSSDAAEAGGLSLAGTRVLLAEPAAEGKTAAEGSGRARRYVLS